MNVDTAGGQAAGWLRQHPRIIDGILAVGLLVLTSMGLGYSGAAVFWLAVAQTLPLALRRDAPFAIALIVASACALQVMFVSGPLLCNVSVLIVIYTVAAYEQQRWQRWAVLGLGMFGAYLAAVRWMSWGVGFPSFEVVTFGLVVLTAWVLGDVVQRRRLVQARQVDQERALARDQTQRVMLASQRERATIAREMHDIVAHSLAVVVVQADGGAYTARMALEQGGASGVDQVGRRSLEHAAQTLETVAATARSALTDTRRLVGVLRDATSDAEYAPQRGLAHLDDLVDGVRTSGRTVRVAIRGEISDLTPDADLAAYRVIQESLTNVLKHAGPQASVDIDILRSPAVLMIRISDDGYGQVEADGDGNGITGMTERVEVLGGTLYAGPRIGGGFEVVASLPVDRVTAVDREPVSEPPDPTRRLPVEGEHG